MTCSLPSTPNPSFPRLWESHFCADSEPDSDISGAERSVSSGISSRSDGRFGASLAWLMGRAGERVTLVDQFEPGDRRASSGGDAVHAKTTLEHDWTAHAHTIEAQGEPPRVNRAHRSSSRGRGHSLTPEPEGNHSLCKRREAATRPFSSTRDRRGKVG